MALQHDNTPPKRHNLELSRLGAQQHEKLPFSRDGGDKIDLDEAGRRKEEDILVLQMELEKEG